MESQKNQKQFRVVPHLKQKVQLQNQTHNDVAEFEASSLSSNSTISLRYFIEDGSTSNLG